jgi:hypothetical protein
MATSVRSHLKNNDKKNAKQTKSQKQVLRKIKFIYGSTRSTLVMQLHFPVKSSAILQCYNKAWCNSFFLDFYNRLYFLGS